MVEEEITIPAAIKAKSPVKLLAGDLPRKGGKYETEEGWLCFLLH